MKAWMLLILLALLPGAAAADSLPVSTYLKPQTLVAVQGQRRLNLSCLGEGAPTVLLDAGLADTMLVWRKVQGEIARTTRVCAYDRAGYGFSDPAPGPSDLNHAAADLHALLRAAKINTPIVYVGHSVAALYGLALAARHPRDVAAEVLIDPSFPHQFERMAAGMPDAVRAGALALYRGQFDGFRACLAAAGRGVADSKCLFALNGPQAIEPELKAVQDRQIAAAPYIRAHVSEFAAILPGDDHAASYRQFAALKPGLGDKPLVILTRGDSGFPMLTPQQSAQVYKAWVQGHDELAGLSRRGSNQIVKGTGHYIQLERPDAVIAAVRGVVLQVRR